MQQNDHFDAATDALTQGLTSAGIAFARTDPMDHLTAAKTAPALCARFGVTSLLLGGLRTEQQVKLPGGFGSPIPHYPTHGEVRLVQLSCTGSIVWSTVTSADRNYYGTNVGSAVTGVAQDAVAAAVAAFAKRSPGAAPPAPAAIAVAVRTPGASAVIVPYGQPGSLDPSLDYVTQRLALRLSALGIATTTIAPIDVLSVPARAAEICAAAGVKTIYTGVLRTEQVNVSKTHADVLVDTLDCTGTVRTSNDVFADITHLGMNARSGVSAATDAALAQYGTAPASPAPATR